MNKVYTICYNRLEVFDDKESAKKFYGTCYFISDGAELERYRSILIDLNFSNIAKDNVSEDCNLINIHVGKATYNSIDIELDKSLPISETIKYYEDKIQPVLEISEQYGINFDCDIPFENFGADDNSHNMSSFSVYYKELLEKFGVEIDNIQVKDWSDGKYNLVVNNQEFKITA